eukprot:357684-Chlamydomonas_euryale.AAC.2
MALPRRPHVQAARIGADSEAAASAQGAAPGAAARRAPRPTRRASGPGYARRGIGDGTLRTDARGSD